MRSANAEDVRLRKERGHSPSTSTASQLSIGGPDPEPHSSLLTDSNGLSRIFLDAVQYNELLEEGKASSDDDDEDEKRDADTQSVLRLAGLSDRNLTVEDFAAASERIAQVSALGKDERFFAGETTEEPEEFASVSELRDSLEEATQNVQRSQSVSQLSPSEIVDILINEFGPLTDPAVPDDKEELLLELDGAFFSEIVILGMLHLTTHRLTFHASLLSTRPDLLPEKRVIKTGPVTLHRKGLRRKMRVWAELSHDMITVFPSSKPEDRIRPVRSMLLSDIEGVLPEDPDKPRVVRMYGNLTDQDYVSYSEFDTEESARDWRREIRSAVYVYHHSRATYLSRLSDNDRKGVQISVPLSRIASWDCFNGLIWKGNSCISLRFSPGKMRTSLDDDNDDSYSDDSGPVHTSESEDELLEASDQKLDFSCHNRPGSWGWGEFGNLVEKAKEREHRASGRIESEVIVDFGELSFVEKRRTSHKVEDDKEASIRKALSLGNEGKLWYTSARISRRFSICTGFFVISTHYISFWAKTLRSSTDSKYRFPINKVSGAKPNATICVKSWGMVLELREHRNLLFDFSSSEERDGVIRRVTDSIQAYRLRQASSTNSSGSGTLVGSESSQIAQNASGLGQVIDTPSTTTTMVSSPRSTTFGSASSILAPLQHTIDRAHTKIVPKGVQTLMPKVLNMPPNIIPRQEPRHFVCLTIGSRGDVQPYISLAQELKRLGNTVTIVTHSEYKDWVEGWGVRHRTAGGDPGALMKLSVEHKMFSPQFFKESLGNFRKWLDDLLVDAWEQCQDAQVLLESPSAMAGVHIAEALNIPYFRTFTMPWSKTTSFPQPFLSPPVDVPSFNASSYVLFDNVFWAATSGQINRWRKNTLHIGKTDMDHMAQSKIPFIYNFSPSVVPKPLDWDDSITISGYWFLDNPDLGWSAPESLLKWIEKARSDHKAIVYIGFGSITVPDPSGMTKSIIKAVLKSDVRAIISKGWSARMSKSDEPEIEYPPECYSIDKIPHDWLFPQIDAALHHGGAGTTGASLRAGIPTLIKPWFGDQFFWASRVQKIGAGLRVSSLGHNDLSNALKKATTDRLMKERAASVGENIRQENGCQNAIRAIYTYLDRASRRTEPLSPIADVFNPSRSMSGLSK